MITYSTNMMGPVNMQWYEERGLTEKVTKVITEDSVLVELGRKNVGDVWEYDVVTTYYAGGRIDIRGVPGDEYWNGWHEYSVAPMHGEDWNALGDYLWDLTTEELLPYDTLIEQFETHYGKKIRWAEDTWYKCYECGLVTDLRKTKEHIHKMGCTRNWDK